MLVLLLLMPVCSAFVRPQPRLIVFLAIDQMRADHLTRFAPLYRHGFKRLLEEGIHFENADLNYSGSSTGPGHATLATGTYPWKSGIVSNSYTDRATGKRVYCVADSTAGPVDGYGGMMSPRNLLVKGFGDWLKATSPASKVVSISYKDRAAILMGGKNPDAAYWYDRTSGRMASSSYYLPVLPGWVRQFNNSGWIAAHLPAQWTRLGPDSVYDIYGPDNMAGESLWSGQRTFPHPIEPGEESKRLFDTPWGNDYLFDFARAALQGEQLGKREAVDVLWISLSATDNVGSAFGPGSHEMIDNLLRIDLGLGKFLADLDSLFGRGGVFLALSGDHGVMPLPEFAVAHERLPARRINNGGAIDSAVRRMDSTLRSELGVTERIIKGGTINMQALKGTNVPARTIEQRLREALLHIDGVADVYFLSELLDASTVQRPYLDHYRHSSLTGRSPDYFIRNCEYCLAGQDSVGTGHGSTYAYDTRVPLIFWGTGKAPGHVDRIVHTVDMVVTTARIFGIPVPPAIDGVPLKELAGQ